MSSIESVAVLYEQCLIRPDEQRGFVLSSSGKRILDEHYDEARRLADEVTPLVWKSY